VWCRRWLHFLRAADEVVNATADAPGDINMLALPASFLYPLPNSMRLCVDSDVHAIVSRVPSSVSFAVHRWGATWLEDLDDDDNGSDFVELSLVEQAIGNALASAHAREAMQRWVSKQNSADEPNGTQTVSTIMKEQTLNQNDLMRQVQQFLQ